MAIIVYIWAGIWFFFAISDPLPETRYTFFAMGLGFIVAYYVPLFIKHLHVENQNRLIGRCRALYILGTEALERGAKDQAEFILRRIRRIEQVWKLGDASYFRASLAGWAILCGIAACIVTRFAGLLLSDISSANVLTADKVFSELSGAWLLSVSAPLYALTGFFDAWKNPWAIENCGDRLWRLLFGQHALETTPAIGINFAAFEGLTPRQIFGLGPQFTRRQLDQARRALVRELHPDRWAGNEDERKGREEALKRVNAAYDNLLKEFS